MCPDRPHYSDLNEGEMDSPLVGRLQKGGVVREEYLELCEALANRNRRVVFRGLHPNRQICVFLGNGRLDVLRE